MAEISARGKKEIAPAHENDILPQDPVPRAKKSKSRFFGRNANKDSVSQVRTTPGNIETPEKKKKSFKSKTASFFQGDKGDKVKSKKCLDVRLEATALEEERVGGDLLRRRERTSLESITPDTNVSPPDEDALEDACTLHLLQQLAKKLERPENLDPFPNQQEWPELPHPPLPLPSPPLSPLREKKTSAFSNPFNRLQRAVGFKGSAKLTKDERDEVPQVSVHSSPKGNYTMLRLQGNSVPPSRHGSQESVASSRHSEWSDFIFVLPTRKTDDDRGVRDLLPSLAERTRIQKKYPNAEIISSGATAPPQRPPQDPDGGGIVNRVRTFFLKIFRPNEYTRRCEVYLAYERDILAGLRREQERYQQARSKEHAEKDAQQARVAELFKQWHEKRAQEAAPNEGAVAEGATPGNLETHEKKTKSFKSQTASFFQGKKGDKVQRGNRLDVSLEAPALEEKRAGGDDEGGKWNR